MNTILPDMHEFLATFYFLIHKEYLLIFDILTVGAVVVEGNAVEVDVSSSVVLVESKAVDDDVVVWLPVLVVISGVVLV